MALVRVEEVDESIVLYFGGEFNRINAYTLASVGGAGVRGLGSGLQSCKIVT